MNPTSLEYLYQVAPPVPDRAPTTSRGDDESSGFDNHLSQAASSVLDIAPSPNRSTTRPSYSPSPTSRAANNEMSPGEATTRPANTRSPHRDNSNDDSGAPTSQTQSNDQPGAASRDDDRDSKRDRTKSDDAPVAAAAGAAQPAAQDAKQADADASQDVEQSAADQAKDKIAADELSKVPTAPKNAQGAEDTKAGDQAKETAAALKAGVAADKASGATVDNSNGTADKASDTSEADTKTAKSAARSAKASAVAANDSKQSPNEVTTSSKSTAGAADTQIEATASAAATTQAIADENQPTEQPKAAPNPKSVGETDQSHKDASNDNAPTVAPVTATPPNVTTAVAHITVQAPIDTAVDKSKPSDSDDAKPIAAKTDSAVGTLGRSLRTDLTGSDKTSNSGDTSPVDITRFVSRVAKAVQTASDRDGVVQLRLSPPELGSLKIQLTVKDGVMSAALEASNFNARRMLLDHLPALRDRLADQNIRVDRFDVDVKQENNGSQANPRGFNQNPYQQQSQETDTRRTATQTPQIGEAAPTETVAAPSRVTANGINLVI